MPASRLCLALCACLVALPSCIDAKAPMEHVYAAYDGQAWPNRRVPVPWPAGPLALTSDNGSDTLTALDPATLTVLAQVPVGRDPVDVDGPHHLAIDRAKNAVYIALSYPAPMTAGAHAGHGVSTQPSGWVQKLALADLSLLGEVRVDANPGDIVLSQDGKRLVVSHFDLAAASAPDQALEQRRGVLTVIDPNTLELLGSPSPARVRTCLLPHGISLAPPDGATAYAACYGEDAVAVVDLAHPGSAVQRIAVGPTPGPPGAPAYGPYSAVASPDAARLAVGCTESKDLRFFETKSLTMAATVLHTQGAPMFAAWSADGARLWVPYQKPNGIVLADVATGKILKTRAFSVQECQLPHEAVLQGGRVLLVCEGSHVGPGSVVALDPETLETLGKVDVGVYPDRLAVAP